MQQVISENPFDVLVINCQIKCNNQQRVSSGYFTGERKNYDFGQNNEIKTGRLLQHNLPVGLNNASNTNVNVSNSFPNLPSPAEAVSASSKQPPSPPSNSPINVESVTKLNNNNHDMPQISAPPPALSSTRPFLPGASTSSLANPNLIKPVQNSNKDKASEIMPKTLPNNIHESPDLIRRRELLNAGASSDSSNLRRDETADNILSHSQAATVGSSSTSSTNGAVSKIFQKRPVPDDRSLSIDYNPKRIMKEKLDISQNRSYLGGLENKADFSVPSIYSESDQLSHHIDPTVNISSNTRNAIRPDSIYTENPESSRNLTTTVTSDMGDTSQSDSSDGENLNPLQNGLNNDDTIVSNNDTKSTLNKLGFPQPPPSYPSIPSNDYSKILEPGRQVLADSRSTDIFDKSTSPINQTSSTDIFDETTAPVNQLAYPSLLDRTTQSVSTLSDSEKDREDLTPSSLSSIYDKKPEDDDDDEGGAKGANRLPITANSWMEDSVYLAPHNNASNTTFSIPPRREIFAPPFVSTPYPGARKRRSPLGEEGIIRNTKFRVTNEDDGEDKGLWM